MCRASFKIMGIVLNALIEIRVLSSPLDDRSKESIFIEWPRATKFKGIYASK